MKKVWKFPSGVNIDNVKKLKGEDGISFLNPIQDLNGNWVVSDEEYNMPQFQWLKIQYETIYNQLELIDYVPIPQQPLV